MSIGSCSNSTHVAFRGEEIDWSTFYYKGCWNCWHFEPSEKFLEEYMYVDEAMEKYKVSRGTIYKWCKNGKLDAELLHRGERKFSLGAPPRVWLIRKTTK